MHHYCAQVACETFCVDDKFTLLHADETLTTDMVNECMVRFEPREEEADLKTGYWSTLLLAMIRSFWLNADLLLCHAVRRIMTYWGTCFFKPYVGLPFLIALSTTRRLDVGFVQQAGL